MPDETQNTNQVDNTTTDATATAKQPHNTKFLLLGIGITVLIIALLAGAYIFGSRSQTIDTTTPSPTDSVEVPARTDNTQNDTEPASGTTTSQPTSSENELGEFSDVNDITIDDLDTDFEQIEKELESL